MLSVQPQELQQFQQPFYLPYRPPSLPRSMPALSIVTSHQAGGLSPASPASPVGKAALPRLSDAQPHSPNSDTVAQALEIARESPDGVRDPTISSVLEIALAQIWSRVQTHPETYVMSRDEFAVFNFFQHLFVGNKVAVAARKRYWDNTRV